MTSGLPFRIFSLGDSALTIEFGDTISESINERAIALSEYLEASRFPGFIETVPAFASTTIYFDLIEVKRSFRGFTTAFEAVADLVSRAATSMDQKPSEKARRIVIPVDFSSSAALDLDFVSERASVSREELIRIFTSSEYRVYMLGFLPGFTYMGEVDPRIASPRKETPRTKVPKGSVGIAGSQTGIYSLDSPGGWQIIGRTTVEMFTPEGALPTLLQPGDMVTFTPL